MPLAETRGAALRRARRSIGRDDARRLLEQACGCTHAELIADAEEVLPAAQAEAFAALVARREAGEPLAYLLGSAYFFDLEFAVTPDVLIPRPDTEVLVREAAALVQGAASARIVDLGTGSGIVAIVLARLCPHAEVSAVDLSPAALAVARTNAVRHGAAVRFLEGDWFAPISDERFDLIVSNPPYGCVGDPHLLRDGLPFEPQLALVDGLAAGDGLACIRAIIEGAPRRLEEGGWLLIEHGYDQAVQVRQLLAAAGFGEISSTFDAAQIERVSRGRWQNKIT